jgi:penicillin amidase
MRSLRKRGGRGVARVGALGAATGARARVAALATAALLAMAGAPARAGVLEAGSVLPPGQSGFVSAAGPSPHLTDQVGLFTRFALKPAGLGQPGTVERPRAGVRVVRDGYGVPAVTGASDADAWWGAGYAIAQDRLAQLELQKRAASGRSAEILGSSALAADVVARRDFYTDAEVDAQIAELPAALRRRLAAYAEGIDAWIARVNADPALLPVEFAALGVAPTPWSARDVARVSIRVARTIPSGDGQELANARALRALGRRAFAELLPLRPRGRVPTIPASEGRFPSQPGRTRADERRALVRSERFLASVRLPGDGAATAAAAPEARAGVVDRPGGSYAWAIRSRDRRRAFLFSAPQVGWAIPDLLVELEVRSPNESVRGVSIPGLPVVGIGHNRHVAWGLTSGLSDDDDLYIERLEGPESYRFGGRPRAMDCRTERFEVRGAAPSEARLCRTVHGPVQERGEGIALARRYAIFGHELETLQGLAELNRSRSLRDVDAAARQVSWNENLLAADDRGHIGYWFPGRLPLRPPAFDERLPYPGTGEAEWLGFVPRSRLPHVVDPRQGYLVQWNNTPSRGWTHGDDPARVQSIGDLHRVRLLDGAVRRAARSASFATWREVDRRVGTTAQQRPFYRAELAAAAAGARPPAREVLRALLAWDGDYARTDGRGTVDPGVAIWQELKAQVEAIVLGPRQPAAALLAGGVGLHLFDVSNGQAFALRRVSRAGLQLAAERTAQALAARFGSGDVATWREPRRTVTLFSLGGVPPLQMPFFDRGTFEQAVALGP